MAKAPTPKKTPAPAAAETSAPKYCPRCYRPEATLDDCPVPSFAGHSCPNLVEADPKRTVTIKDGVSGFVRVIPVRDLINGTAAKELPKLRDSRSDPQVI